VGILSVFCFADRYSRKLTLQVGGCLGLVGAIMQTAAQDIAVFSVGRVVAGIATGIMLTTVQVYQSEIAPPAVRGRMVSLQLLTITLAGTTAAFTGYGTFHSSNPDIQW
jgi:MFS family permease